MSKTRIFLSSTCYDLRALREHLRKAIEECGHELLASEYSSFPVSPDLSTVENCKKVVRELADVFVLVVGGRRGSSDPSTARSVVNAEYLEAKARNMATFVFVDKQVMDLLSVYQKNPAADFSPAVDHPEVFTFIEQLKADSRWIYTFARTDEIIATVKNQLSVYLKMLIERGRVGALIVPRDFASDSLEVISLIQERPPFWEHLLTCAFLDEAIHSAREYMKLLEEGGIYKPAELLSDEEALPRISKFFADMLRILEALNVVLARLPQSWGPVGVTGNPVEIRIACQRVSKLIDALLEWEITLRSIQVSELLQPLFDSLRGSTKELIDKLGTIAPHMREAIKRAKTEPGPHRVELIIEIGSPQTLEQFQRELAIARDTLGI